MLWFLSLTQECNNNCVYCGGGDIEAIAEGPHPMNIEYDLNLVNRLVDKSFLSNEETSPLNICFYGGEPLLKRDKIRSVIEQLPESTVYILQTNGTLLNLVDVDIILKLHTILVSIDGTKEHTDHFRGNGIHDKVIRNCKWIRSLGFKGDLVARMTVTVGTDIYKEVQHLLTVGNGLFSHVHWQLDCQWDSATDNKIDEFVKWRDTVYNPGITMLLNDFMSSLTGNMRKKVLGIVPFTGVLHSLIYDIPVKLRCGSGVDAFNITTGGDISACPIAPDFDGAVVGKMSETFDPKSVVDSCLITEPCYSCDIRDKCGGRCLYANRTKWWGARGFLEVCETVRHLFREIERVLPEIKEILSDVDGDDLFYPTFNNSCEIIP